MMKWNEPYRQHLPSSAALRSFLAAARLGSFSLAGDSVGLTQSAVSRQISQLEAQLGVALFVRTGRRVELSGEGRAYAEAIGPALEQIARAGARLAQRRGDNELTIATLPSFGMRWLAPRLPRLSVRHPELVINVASRTWPFTSGAQGLDDGPRDFDAAFDFGRPPWGGMQHALLFREEAVVVCSPHWLAANPLREPADLVGKPLLFQSSRRQAWDAWFAANGVALAAPCTGPSIEHFLMLAQAAAAGAGLALIPSFLIAPELSAGTLVAPLDRPFSTDQAYYLVWPQGGEAGSALSRFIAWAKNEASRTE
ncbi:LysR substrate-binding domain-containing protein [Novosphingobium sp. 1949]|uniref:LysR substrate-binding domain-containing protein n=1 Tax=Novosphingobium organovorum TaxID=2930092 RepID=A0ABT0BB03_9SPHN|nr:LysR substrate-binding domain-containing protein [Novosphingobium organovorum]MCJ2181979.1 LysR substrate-binding domain-containing protein [Novosphingobium organovorum]